MTIRLSAAYHLKLRPHESIKVALMKALKDFPSLPACAWPNQQFSPEPDQIWVRPTLMLAQIQPAAIGVDAPNMQAGLFQISVFAPAGTDDGDAFNLAAALCSYFKRGTRFEHDGVVVMVRRAWPAGTPVEEPEWYQVPVTVDWLAYTENE